MCGSDVVPWENIKKRMRDGAYGIVGQHRGQAAKHTDVGTVIAQHAFPDAEYTTLLDLQGKWRSGSWDRTLYDLLYTFRRFEATVARDRIYAFLGLASDIKSLDLVPDYSSPTSKIFTDTARALIVVHKHLLLFNLKREPATQRSNTQQQSQIYSLLDQIRFLDPHGLVSEGEGKSPRQGWVRLPRGWERRQVGSRFLFYNHLTRQYQDTSPLVGQAPVAPQRMQEWASLPPEWKKTWDNIGNSQFIFDPDVSDADQIRDKELEDLPSWVPDWSQWSTRDAEPFPSLVAEEARYWASGKARKVHFASAYESNSKTLKLTGVLFDRIVSLARPWCPEPHLLPVDRLSNKILQDWESLVLTPVPNDPYARSGGRYNAFWRTHIADYAGAGCATPSERGYFEAWANRGEWVSRVPDSFSATDKSSWQKSLETVTDQQIMNSMCAYLVEKGYEKAFLNPVKGVKTMWEWTKRYKELRKRIHSALIGRVMVVTSKGYIGLSPWNAQEGDVVSVLFGGCTPFVLRETADAEVYTLVGEAYVYDIMGGELFSGEMGHPRLRAFDII
ncbi:Nn.00g100090.m01.CDS01 [Neocucurbitaria sp. VM-36]